MRVLVVEDEVLLSRQLASALGDAGYAVDCAADGERADFLGQTERYDAVILDLGLPKIDGIEVARQLRRDESVPILMLTARDALEARVTGLDAGADDYLVKPFERQELLARIRALLRRTPPRGSARTMTSLRPR